MGTIDVELHSTYDGGPLNIGRLIKAFGCGALGLALIL